MSEPAFCSQLTWVQALGEPRGGKRGAGGGTWEEIQCRGRSEQCWEIVSGPGHEEPGSLSGREKGSKVGGDGE